MYTHLSYSIIGEVMISAPVLRILIHHTIPIGVMGHPYRMAHLMGNGVLEHLRQSAFILRRYTAGIRHQRQLHHPVIVNVQSTVTVGITNRQN